MPPRLGNLSVAALIRRLSRAATLVRPTPPRIPRFSKVCGWNRRNIRNLFNAREIRSNHRIDSTRFLHRPSAHSSAFCSTDSFRDTLLLSRRRSQRIDSNKSVTFIHVIEEAFRRGCEHPPGKIKIGVLTMSSMLRFPACIKSRDPGTGSHGRRLMGSSHSPAISQRFFPALHPIVRSLAAPSPLTGHGGGDLHQRVVSHHFPENKSKFLVPAPPISLLPA